MFDIGASEYCSDTALENASHSTDINLSGVSPIGSIDCIDSPSYFVTDISLNHTIDLEA